MSQVSFTLSMIGINTVIFYWPLIFILHYTNQEVIPEYFEIPWAALSIRGSCSVIMNFFITYGIAYINSLVVAIGGLLAIPLNAIVDTILKRDEPHVLKAIGSILIVIGFLILLFPDSTFDIVEPCWKKRKIKRSKIVSNFEDENCEEC